MKIIGYSYIDQQAELVMRADSSLLNNHKPFFVPQGTEDVQMVRAVILRVSRMGKSIAARFATRYYDAWAPALSIRDQRKLQLAREQHHSWTEAMCFDYSLVIGDYIEDTCPFADRLCKSFDEAVEHISHLMTIRQGDLIYIEYQDEPQTLSPETVINGPEGMEDKLYCKIK